MSELEQIGTEEGKKDVYLFLQSKCVTQSLSNCAWYDSNAQLSKHKTESKGKENVNKA